MELIPIIASYILTAACAYLIGRQSRHQITSCKGEGNVVIQSECHATGDIVGKNLFKKGGKGGRCEYCGGQTND